MHAPTAADARCTSSSSSSSVYPHVQVLGAFVFAACMFGFVTQISVVVMEKELGLKQALRTMGMTDLAFWASWWVLFVWDEQRGGEKE